MAKYVIVGNEKLFDIVEAMDDVMKKSGLECTSYSLRVDPSHTETFNGLGVPDKGLVGIYNGTEFMQISYKGKHSADIFTDLKLYANPTKIFIGSPIKGNFKLRILTLDDAINIDSNRREPLNILSNTVIEKLPNASMFYQDGRHTVVDNDFIQQTLSASI